MARIAGPLVPGPAISVAYGKGIVGSTGLRLTFPGGARGNACCCDIDRAKVAIRRNRTFFGSSSIFILRIIVSSNNRGRGTRIARVCGGNFGLRNSSSSTRLVGNITELGFVGQGNKRVLPSANKVKASMFVCKKVTLVLLTLINVKVGLFERLGKSV